MQLTFDPNPSTDIDRIDDRELSLFDAEGSGPTTTAGTRGRRR
ncbi:hypothetical protein [Halorarum halobium]|nr:hypothetical protein [Halobaculum sp. XH14]